MDRTDVAAALSGVVAHLAGGGEARPGQVEMAVAVAEAIESGRHLVVQAGTGTGKSLGYLVPALLAGRPTVVATATKALQDQLAGKDLPFLQKALDGVLAAPFSFAVLKGRSNYLCLQRAREVTAASAQASLELDDVSPTVREEIRRLVSWSGVTDSGDRAELPWEPSVRAWSAVSVGADECPGATRCPLADPCFAESARRRAAAADVVVVNLHLYGTHLAAGGYVLPEHDVVVIDEAHQLEDVIADTCAVGIGPGRFAALARLVRAVVADDTLVGELAGAGSVVAGALLPHHGRRLQAPLPADVVDAIGVARDRVQQALGALRSIDSDIGDVAQRKLRAQRAATTLSEDLDAVLVPGPERVSWVEGPDQQPVLITAPIDVSGILADGLFGEHVAVLTSATIGSSLPSRVGLDEGDFEQLDVGSPFDYEAHALLYCAMALPDPRRAEFEPAMHEELAALVRAAGGRTLALFTSWRAMRAAAEAVAARVPFAVLRQGELPKPALVKAFSEDTSSCLFATAGFFQGVDIPGATLSLVTIDRIPFPRPDEPLLQARRERAGAAAFSLIDLPRAATLLAQASGRLIRTADDRGVVAVFDRRLGTAGYRWDLVRALPPMRRTRDRAEAETFLQALQAQR